jgi:signal transduction histidine kinase/ActR/RegA family two-component response regulator
VDKFGNGWIKAGKIVKIPLRSPATIQGGFFLSKAMDNGSHAPTPFTEIAENIATFIPALAEWDGKGDHFAQFYDADAFLLGSLSSFVVNGLNAGDAVIVVASESHRDGLAALLVAQGIDISEARDAGRYMLLDAGETLSRFIVQGALDAERFAEVIGSIINEGAARGRLVRVFGEMVALLVAEGKPNDAIQLEALWNGLRQTHPFLLFCAYPMSAFGTEAFSGQLIDVCSAHSAVIPAETYTALQHHDERLRAVIELQQKAQALEAEIVERRKIEGELRASLTREQMARSEAEAANRMKDEFLATVSHELRTPLNAIMGWSHMLRGGRLDPVTVERALETIDRNARCQAQLVEDILDVSRMITGKLRLDIEPVDVATIMNAAIDAVQLAAESKGLNLSVTLDPSARHILGDSGRLQQVVWNLLSNAIKFTPSGGRVELRLERVNANVQISVSDTGQGIKPEFLPFVFDRFRQADSTSTRQIGGLGLGLAIVRQLIELHGGTVGAASEGEGRGATFTVVLPLATTERAKFRRSATGTLRPIPEDLNAAVATAMLVDLQVLLVDDDQDTLQMLSISLLEHRVNVQTASSAEEALEVMTWFKPDVLVSDLAMPNEDGYSLIGKVRAYSDEKVRQTPAVALTSYVRIEDRTRALSAGFNMFVPKPVQPNELITAIASLAQPSGQANKSTVTQVAGSTA